MTKKFIRGLEETARLLGKFADPAYPGTRTWNGKAYVAGPANKFDPGASKWSGALIAIAGMLSSQDTPLSEQQKEFLRRFLFGGMGSLNDLALDETCLGSDAKAANEELNRLRAELFAAFRQI